MATDDIDDIHGGRLDWRAPAHYNALLSLDRAGWAWKWLRRNPDYVAWTATRPQRPMCVDSDVPVIPAAESDDASFWGLHFCRIAESLLDRGQTVLANGLGCVGDGGDGATDGED